jgi:hypothetical protein
MEGRAAPLAIHEAVKMGMDQTIRFPAGQSPSWQSVRDLLAARRFLVQMRMIDGELAFPDEEPGEAWRELRLATQEGMAVTVKREGGELKLVVWGNADQKLIQAWNALTWAFAEAGQGMIDTPQGVQTASEYWNQADLPEAVRQS